MYKRPTLPLACVLAIAIASPGFADGITAESAFERLSALAGEWSGSPEGTGEAEAETEMAGKAHHSIELSSGGTVVMETMAPKSPNEMINVYHLDGDDLVLTHYCALGNQPKMRLDREQSSEDRLIFDYVGGTNHDPAVDQHIHSADIRWVDDDEIVSSWTAFAGGEAVGTMTVRLNRAE